MTTGIAVELRQVSKRFGEIAAVDDVSLRIADGEFFSLLGPSGCGKTTTLRMIAGFEMPTDGEIFIKGQPMGSTPPYRRHVNTVFQSYALFPHLTVAENVAFGLQMHNVPKAEITRRVADALRLVRLDEYGKRRPRQLSGGQQQRVALARALVNQPAVLLLDEPLGALDLKLRKELQLELRGLQERVGITFVYVTHDQEEALTMSDRIAVMSGGKVLQIGTPTEIYERPTCRFVADFIGETNFLRGSVMQSDTQQATVRVGDSLVVEGYTPQPVQAGQPVTVSIRPEKARLSEQHPQTSTNVFPVKVERIAYIGSDTRIFVTLDGQHRFVVWEQNNISTLNPNAFYAQGDTAYLTWPVENALVLTE
ncbi:MAG TPA: ABC transporter ATP-binding protein [Herpetosiphonaceae bacterium]